MVPAPNPSGSSSGSSQPPSNRRPGSAFSRHVSRVTDRFDDLLPFALVPLALSLLEVESVAWALDPGRDVSINIEFAFPSPLLDLWSFVDPPETTGAGGIGPGSGTDVTIEFPFETVGLPAEVVTGGTLGLIAIVFLVYAVLGAIVTAGYLGGIDRRLRGEPAAIPQCITRYAPRFLLYYVVLFGAFLALVPLVFAAPALLLIAIPAVFVLGYLFYAAPFLFVVADVGVFEGFRRSYGYALEGGAYFWFCLWHAVLVVAAVSLVMSLFVTTAGAVGFLIALAVTVPLSLMLSAATVSLCQELDRLDGRGATTCGSTDDRGPAGGASCPESEPADR